MMVGHLSSHEQEMSATVSQLHSQLEAVTAKLNELTAPPPAPEAASGKSRGATRPAGKRGAAPDPRLKKMEARLDAQKKQLQETQDENSKTRADLEGNLRSTRDELSGTIARNHDELVALEKRGERSFLEFELNRSKPSQRIETITTALPKVDAKHKAF